jgi:superfamily II DNA or RNA helicase
VAGSLARSLNPPEQPHPAPQWLLPEQRRSFGRVLAAIQRYGGALLADPVGSGKTFVALAAAQAINRAATACLVPAALLTQWKATADRLAIPVVLCSHEQISRGKMPSTAGGLVLIDESHHFRNPRTKRYRHLAPWLIGRRALLITATPVVNNLLDLAYQLLLTIRDDALAWDGIASLRNMLASSRPTSALGQLIVESEAVTSRRPDKVCSRILPSAAAWRCIARAIELVDQLQLSTCRSIAALIRGVLLRALCSSPAAFEAAVRRYRRLLLHARDSLHAGQVLDRAELRRFTAELGDQLVWWELLPRSDMQSEIALTDLDGIDGLIRYAERVVDAPDLKLARLQDLLRDNTPTLVFTASRDTVRYIRQRLGTLRLAWCTGVRAGIGSTNMSRATVLASFQQANNLSLAPIHLIVTDVAAEGLNLQRAARVVHYDLPWTPMRMDQREGRSIRYGSRYSQIDVVEFAVPPLLERRLRVEATLKRKARLPALAGLGSRGNHIWRWRAELAARFDGTTGQRGVAVVPSSTTGLLAGFALCIPGEAMPLSATVLWLEPTGKWTEAPSTVGEKLTAAAAQIQTIAPDPAAVGEWIERLAVPIRERLAQVKRQRWIMLDQPSVVRQILSRLQQLIREAARNREARRLAELEHAIAAVAGGHTAGEMALLERLAEAGDSELVRRLGTLPSKRPTWQSLEVRLTGMVIFGPPPRAGTVVASLECGSTQYCSTSTVP